MTNPFRPGFGESPTVWAGRAPILDNFARAVETPGATGRTVLINGSRGIGKTALLNELEDIAATRGWIVLRAPSHAAMLTELVDHSLPAALAKRTESPGRQITGISVAAIGSVTTQPAQPPQITQTLTSLLRRLAQAVPGVLITVDEVQAAHPSNLQHLATSMQDAIRDDLPVAFAGAGLTAGVSALLDHPGTTFLRRSLRYQLAPLTLPDSIRLTNKTVESSDKAITPHAAETLAARAHGYPYLIQLIGALAWDLAGTTITEQEVEEATNQAIPILGNQVHLPEVAALSHRQVDFLRAMAHVADREGTARISEVAAAMSASVTSLSTARRALIDADLLHAPAWGTLRFRLPYFREFLLGPGGPLEVA
ncbi:MULTISPECIES: ATP-binding protein [unclassified Corynebacterium]|uniref:ATP-binding protein n=1 Tax=unclassified Corynebacterium TaxID=2624378 RepID=UPI0029C9EB42|nr:MULTISPECIES: ATP-binding protein [unclassified Corynebacterium]WPF67165.1 ATP-binding protein [Corynebacterium sp. 22KM0430]WPF69654.1 ATP-binding protein [Corynebacterium sp. 21KM1197]